MNVKDQTAEEKPSLVPPVVAGLISLVVPGLGHMLARQFRKGLVLLLVFLSASGLWIWRVMMRQGGKLALLPCSKRLSSSNPSSLLSWF